MALGVQELWKTPVWLTRSWSSAPMVFRMHSPLLLKAAWPPQWLRTRPIGVVCFNMLLEAVQNGNAGSLDQEPAFQYVDSVLISPENVGEYVE